MHEEASCCIRDWKDLEVKRIPSVEVESLDEMIRTSEERIKINVLGNTKMVAPETSVSGG